MKRTVTAACAAILFILAPAAGEPAAPAGPPDPTTLAMPPLPLAFAEKDRESGDDRFYFHKQGVSYQAAFADFGICRGYSQSVELIAKPKDYAPLGTNIVAPNVRGKATEAVMANPAIGLIAGAILGGYVEGQITQSAIRLCMAYKGYKRFAVSRAAYRQIDRGSDTEIMARQALVASGPTPQGGEVGQ